MDLYHKNLQKNLPYIYTKKIPEEFEISPSSNDCIFKGFCYRKEKNEYTPKKTQKAALILPDKKDCTRSFWKDRIASK